jgi:hypothetical protein
MTRSNSAFLLRRIYQHVIAGAGALALTALVLFSVQTHAATPRMATVTPSVTILVPTVTIEAVE